MIILSLSLSRNIFQYLVAVEMFIIETHTSVEFD